MKDIRCSILCACVSSALLIAAGSLSAQVPLAKTQSESSGWKIVVNNGVVVPGDTRTFNSYNQPSINTKGLVVFRGRSKAGDSLAADSGTGGSGGGEPAHGVYLRDMSLTGSSVTTLFDRNTLVPQPNNISMRNTGESVTFTEPPSFPRIDVNSSTVASRGSHQPVWGYETGEYDESTGEAITTRAGTTGIYTNPFGPLISGANNLGAAPGFGFFSVPGVRDAKGNSIKFDVFPGAPAVADAKTIVFKGNYSVPDPNDPSKTLSKTGVYYRRLVNESIYNGSLLGPAGGSNAVVKIADTGTVIPGYESAGTTFGSTAPPSAVNNQAVFAGFDNEDDPKAGGIYLASLDQKKPQPLTPLVKIGDPVPGETRATFNKLGEGLSFDGRFVAFWGAWGTETTELILQCPTDGNKSIKEYCNSLYGPEGSEMENGYHTSVPVHQGIFVHDLSTHVTWSVAKTPTDYADFVYWNFSGKVPPPQGKTVSTDPTIVAAADGGSSGDGGKEGETDGEPARWRSASFVAVSGLVDGKVAKFNMYAAFKARTGTVENGAYSQLTDGIYLWQGPVNPVRTTLVDTNMLGTVFDPKATYIPVDEETGSTGPETPLPVTAMGIERDGLRGKTLAVNISMGNEDAGWAGIYLTQVPQ